MARGRSKYEDLFFKSIEGKANEHLQDVIRQFASKIGRKLIDDKIVEEKEKAVEISRLIANQMVKLPEEMIKAMFLVDGIDQTTLGDFLNHMDWLPEAKDEE